MKNINFQFWAKQLLQKPIVIPPTPSPKSLEEWFKIVPLDELIDDLSVFLEDNPRSSGEDFLKKVIYPRIPSKCISPKIGFWGGVIKGPKLIKKLGDMGVLNPLRLSGKDCTMFYYVNTNNALSLAPGFISDYIQIDNTTNLNKYF